MNIKNITYLIILYIKVTLCHKHLKTTELQKSKVYTSNLYNDYGSLFTTPTTIALPTNYYI